MTPATHQLQLPLPDLVEKRRQTQTNSTVFVNNMTRPVHRWFRFSAGFSADWAESVIREHASLGSRLAVLDPFVGSGTTLLAAQAAGASLAAGVESHPFIARIARAKLLWHRNPNVLIERSRLVLDRAAPRQRHDVPPLLDKCYPSEVLAELDGLHCALEEVSEGDGVDELLWLALVSILRDCSPVGTANWQYVLPNKRKARSAEPRAAFEGKVMLIAQDMVAFGERLEQRTEAVMLEEDARECGGVADGSVQLVITSPPYPNNFDYADATRLEMTFLGEVRRWGDLQAAVRDRLLHSCSQHMGHYDAEAALSGELLAPIAGQLRGVYRQLSELRHERRGHKRYDAMVVAYFHDLAQTWAALRRVCAPGALACFVVGDSAPYGVHVPVEQWLGALALASGFKRFKFEKLRDRNNKWLNRKHRVPLHEGRLWVEG